MAAQLQIDQDGLDPGTPGKSRTDGRDDGSLVTLTNTGSGATTTFNLLWVPPGDTTAVSSLAATEDPKVWTFTPTAERYGSYRIELVENEGLVTEKREIRILAVRTPNFGIVIPALNERGSTKASLLAADSTMIEAAENNADDYESDEALNELQYAAWWRSMHELALGVDQGAGNKVLAYTEYLSGSGTHEWQPDSTLRIIHIQGGGGGGGGVLGTTSACRVAAGGQAGGWREIVETGPPTGTGDYTVGDGGTGGIGNTTPSTPGGDTSIGLNSGTESVSGGVFAGNASSGGTTAGIRTPAPGPGVPNTAGEYGSVAFNLTSTLGISGSGGCSPYGRGGAPFFATGARDGQDGEGRGSGGSGGSVVNSGTANGGNGIGGLIRIWEFG